MTNVSLRQSTKHIYKKLIESSSDIENTNIEDDDDLTEEETYALAFQIMMDEKLDDIISDEEDISSVHIDMSVLPLPDVVEFSGYASNISKNVIEEILSYGTQYDCSGDLSMGVDFTVRYSYNFLEEYVELAKETTGTKDGNDDSEKEEDKDNSKDNKGDNENKKDG